MTKLLEQAFQKVSGLDARVQDEIARAMFALARDVETAPAALTQAERDAIAKSEDAAKRGEFATEEQVRAVWAKHGR